MNTNTNTNTSTNTTVTKTPTKVPRALAEYRRLPPAERASFDPSGRPGAARVRELQWIARQLRAARDPARRAAALERIRHELGRPEPMLERSIQQRHDVVPLGPQDAETCARIAKETWPRKRNWLDPEAIDHATTSVLSVEYHSFRYRGRYRKYIGWTYTPIMQSVARISHDGSVLGAVIGHTDRTHAPGQYIIPAGRGYCWDADAHGVRLVRLRDGADYHPCSDDIRAGRKAIVAALREHAEVRKREAAEARRQKKTLAGAWVSFQDARSAGNCQAGIVSYAARHGLDLRRHYRADRLPVDDEETQRRIALAALAAQRRQAKEMAAGFCALT